MKEIYPSREALAGALAGMEGGMPESFAQLTSFSSPWARAENGHDARDLALRERHNGPRRQSYWPRHSLIPALLLASSSAIGAGTVTAVA